MTGQPRDRIVTGNISLSLDGRVTGPAGDHDMGWIVPHALTSEARAHLLKITSTASTALLGRKNYQGFAGFWPAVAGDDGADPRDRAFARWLNEADKVVVSRTLTEASWPGSRVVADELDRLSITLCPELVGAGTRLFGDGPAGSSWSLTEVTPAGSGALCLLYDLIRPAAGSDRLFSGTTHVSTSNAFRERKTDERP